MSMDLTADVLADIMTDVTDMLTDSQIRKDLACHAKLLAKVVKYMSVGFVTYWAWKSCLKLDSIISCRLILDSQQLLIRVKLLAKIALRLKWVVDLGAERAMAITIVNLLKSGVIIGDDNVRRQYSYQLSKILTKEDKRTSVG